jgi:predicted metal-dependent hydrolase
MDGFPFHVEVVRTDRKRSASIRLLGDLVKVIVPMTLSDSRIRDLIAKRTSWIKSKLQEQSDRPIAASREYVSGETVTYLGKNYRLKVLIGDQPSMKLKRGYVEATITQSDLNPEKTIRSLLQDWYRSLAEKRLCEKTVRLAQAIGVSPSSVTIKDYKSRWGSCSTKGDISYNWRIILAPHSIVDYVVVHELCHMLEHNHSSKYWKHVERHVPRWRECREWLKHNELAKDL